MRGAGERAVVLFQFIGGFLNGFAGGIKLLELHPALSPRLCGYVAGAERTNDGRVM
jgi:hypothetical protein